MNTQEIEWMTPRQMSSEQGDARHIGRRLTFFSKKYCGINTTFIRAKYWTLFRVTFLTLLLLFQAFQAQETGDDKSAKLLKF